MEGDDLYRHSKWLAMMERRLALAKELLDPVNSVLIVTIDEKEYLRLGLLLEQLFPEAHMQMVSSSINPKGSARGKEFYRVDEYIYFLTFGPRLRPRLPNFRPVHKPKQMQTPMWLRMTVRYPPSVGLRCSAAAVAQNEKSRS